jgi:TatD DNase family protein
VWILPQIILGGKRLSTLRSAITAMPRFVDIGANLLDERFTEGMYHGKVRHEPDFVQVVERACQIGMRHMVLTAGSLEDSRAAVPKVRELREANTTKCQFYCTVGVHPTRCNEFLENDADKHLQALIDIAKDGMRDGTVAAVGEMGLDYDRLEFCPKEIQQTYFEKQLELAKETGLPLFLHNRNVGSDVYDILSNNKDKWSKAVVHSFDDSIELANKFIELGDIYIGLNGCSLRTPENLKMASQIDLSRILLETDAPYCEVKKTHSGYEFVKTFFPTKPEKKYESGSCVKGRNEPCHIVQVAEVIAGVRGITVEELADACYENSLRLYGWKQ